MYYTERISDPEKLLLDEMQQFAVYGAIFLIPSNHNHFYLQEKSGRWLNQSVWKWHLLLTYLGRLDADARCNIYSTPPNFYETWGCTMYHWRLFLFTLSFRFLYEVV
jgi:hypothetical protein